jgi:hypothetical protein
VGFGNENGGRNFGTRDTSIYRDDVNEKSYITLEPTEKSEF